MRVRCALVIMVALVFTSCGDDDVFTSTTARPSTTMPGSSTSVDEIEDTTSSTGGPSTTATDSAAVGESGWRRVPHDEAVFGPGPYGSWAFANAVVGDGPGLVAVGSRVVGGDFHAGAAVWVSSDGIDWMLLPHDPEVFGGWGLEEMSAAAAGGPGMVAVGTLYNGVDFDAAVWTSSDGLTWSQAHDAGFGGPGWQSIQGVAAGGPGIVAVGRDDSTDPSEWWDAAVWTSSDGLTWDRVPHDEALFGGRYDQSMAAVVAGGPGFVAVGYDESGDDRDVVVWVSADGTTWSKGRSYDFDMQGDQEMLAVAPRSGGFIAVGYDDRRGDRDAAVWLSDDGIEWYKAPFDESVCGGRGDQVMQAVSEGPAGLVAVGYDHSGEDRDAAVWTSVNGEDWVRVPRDTVIGGPGDQEMKGVVPIDGGFVAVGSCAAGEIRNAAVWVWVLPG